jgi:hypothetical protein
MKTLVQKLAEIQQNMKAPKGQFNKFGNYRYRSCEDILEALKPLLGDYVLTISDEIVPVGSLVYIKATATLTDGEHSISNSAYARKYALNGLFCIDDTKDADATNDHGKGNAGATVPQELIKACREKNKEWIITNWQTVVVPNWNNLSEIQQKFLNQIAKGE